MNNSVRRMVAAVAIATAMVLHHTNEAVAQETDTKPSPEEAQVMMEQMLPGVLRVMLGVLLEFYADPRVAEMEATYARNLYESLQKEGFSKDEALAIVVGYGNPVRLQSGK